MENMDGVDPTVLVIGSGHSGLNIAARLGMLDITGVINYCKKQWIISHRLSNVGTGCFIPSWTIL